jgi:peptidoglycan-N-acetylglucosamine deacetylase
MRPLGIRWWSPATVARLLVLVVCGLVAGVAPNARASASAASRHTPTDPPPLTLAFYDTETNDRAQLLAHLDLATQLAPTGFYVTAGGQLETRGDHRSIAELAHARSVQVYPVVQNYRFGSFHGEDLGWLASPMERRAMTAATLRAVSDARADGVDVDFQNLPTTLRQDFTSFVSELSARFHRAGQRVLVDLPVEHAAYDSAQLARVSDWLILMAYDQHSLPGQPGPIAGRPWVHAALAQMRHEVPASKLVLGLPGYGYDWTPRGVEPLSYREVLRRADTAAGIRWDAASSEPWFAYTDRDGVGHTVWFSDAPSMQPLLREGRKAGLAGISLWRLGLEDPATWAVLGRRARNAGRSTALAVVSVDPVRRGSGEVASIPQSSQEGRRVLTWDPAGEEVVGERYLSLPRPEQVLETGLRPGTVALTFDDGPDPVWTPRVLDILRRYQARATFFVIGRQASAHPELVTRMYAEGHEVGNHTFTHAADLQRAPPWRFRLELSLTQRIIQAATGHSATLFRYPYMGSLTDLDRSDEGLIDRPAEQGYRLVGQSLDTLDWARPGAELIAAGALDDPDGKVILLHDGGGNRGQTLAALPFILEWLRHRGLRILPLSEAAGGLRATAMPPVSGGGAALDGVVLGTGWVLAHGSERWLFLVNAVVLFALARVLILGLFGFLHWLMRPRRHRSPYRGPVSAVVPAHNEERVIGATIEALLRSDHQDLEVIVVDDGSTDATAERVTAFHSRGVRLIEQPNEGKAAALRRGFAAARHPVVVALDADTLFTHSTVRRLVEPFGDARVGAVAGNPKVGNRVNLVTRLQVLEYVLTLNLERRAYAWLGCVAVVPGAAGAWRRDLVLAAGGFSGETLAEDTDLTLALGRKGYSVEYAPHAIAYTEAPQTMRGLARQRSRWAFGMLQCLWKHRRGLLSPRARAFGLVAIPGLALGQLVLPLVAPTIDIGLLLALSQDWASRILPATIAYNAVLVGLGAWALAVDREPVQLALLAPLQNLLYRQFQYVIALHAVLRALRGMRVGWSRVARLGTSTIGSVGG